MIRVGSRAGNAARRLGQLHRITHSVSLPHFSSVHPPPPLPPLPPFNPISYTFRYYDPCLRLNCTHIFSSALPCSLSMSERFALRQISTLSRVCLDFFLLKIYFMRITSQRISWYSSRSTRPTTGSRQRGRCFSPPYSYART